MPKTLTTSDTAQQLGERVVGKTEQVIDHLQASANELGHEASSALSRAAGQVEDLTRRTLDRARQASTQVRDQVGRAGDATVGYIKDEPVKSVLIAAATGAAAVALLTWLSRSRRD